MNRDDRPGRNRTRWLTRSPIVLATCAAVLAFAVSASAASPMEQADIVGQGADGPVVSAGGAEIRRGVNGLTAKVSLATPEPGSYVYPQGPTASGIPGHPEAFSLWVFIFFNPESCDGACDGPDLQANPDVIAGAFNAGGHLVGGPKLTISGKANGQSTVFGGPNAETIAEALDLGFSISGAEIHLAVAPHGALDPVLLPQAIKTPVGNPTFWWLAFFE
jgi:hypothetical protein